MKITRRQEEFITQLHELSQEFEGPIHYSILAERLGVSPFTAYDMLCLLEEKGLAVSEYQLAEEKNGPGRAERVFYPSQEALTRCQHLWEAANQNETGGDGIPEFLLAQIRQDRISDRELTEQILARIPPETHSQEQRYCMEVLGVMAFRLADSPGRPVFARYLRDLLAPEATVNCQNLSLLAGFAFGILAQDNTADPDWVENLWRHVKQTQETLSQLPLEACAQLAAYWLELLPPRAPESTPEILTVVETTHES